jgi:hypothetical protein
MRATSETMRTTYGEEAVTKKSFAFEGAKSMADDHSLGRSKSNIVRSHWVPTIPGYGGFIPAKEAENIHGGGISRTCRLAGRAIAERGLRKDPLDSAPGVTVDDGLERTRIVDYYQELNHDQNGLTHERSRLVDHLRGHCSGKIPGYTGFIPRVHGESMYGARAAEINRIASDICEDRIVNPADHGRRCCAPQFPEPRKLRM